MSKAIVIGSIRDIARKEGMSIAETFLGVDALIVVDVSGSMRIRDSRDGLSRYEVAIAELEDLQHQLPGKIAVVAFSDTSMFCPNGIPPCLGGLTNLAGALRFVKVADIEGIAFYIISDGQPNSESAAIAEAHTFDSKINCIYVGPEHSDDGRRFLKRLAKASGGQYLVSACADDLSKTVQLLLESGNKEKEEAIQL